jgi:uncharacterized membrane protein
MKHLLPIAVASVLLGACGPDLPEVDCTAPVPTYAEVTIFTNGKCNLCHASTVTGANRMNAPSDVNYDTYAAAQARAEDAVAEVFAGEMPPAGFEAIAPTEAEKQVLYRWGLCGAPP